MLISGLQTHTRKHTTGWSKYSHTIVFLVKGGGKKKKVSQNHKRTEHKVKWKWVWDQGIRFTGNIC